MRVEALAALLESVVEEFRRSTSHWQFAHQDIPMACLVDPGFDRMRFIAPITELSNLDEQTKDELLEANFHTTLDARYGSSNGLLFAAFVHPLGSLDDALARSALDQVASLVHTFGTQYSGGTLEFLGARDDNEHGGGDGDEDGAEDDLGDDDDDDPDGSDGMLLN